MCLEIEADGKRMSISNVHLDYRHALNREIEIMKLTEYIGQLKTDYNIMLGDFNTYPSSSVHGYLTGRNSLNGKSARWIDLGEAYSARAKTELDVTIDFFGSPRWQNEHVLDIPGRFDWILLENPYPMEYPRMSDYRVIGKTPVKGITPSDHYGVVCQLEF